MNDTNIRIDANDTNNTNLFTETLVLFVAFACISILVSHFVPLTKKQKESVLKGIEEKLARQKAFVITGFSRIGVEKLKELRRALKEKGGDFQVIKKTFLRIALKKAGISAKETDIKNVAEGSLGVAFFYDDTLVPANAVYTFSRDKEVESFKILGGVLEGEEFGADAIIKFAKIGSKENLMARFVCQLNVPVSKLVYVLKAIADKP